jgi:hypothetical protein
MGQTKADLLDEARRIVYAQAAAEIRRILKLDDDAEEISPSIRRDTLLLAACVVASLILAIWCVFAK